MLERTETTEGDFGELFPVSRGLVFTIIAPVEKRKTEKGKVFYMFKTSTALAGKTRKYTQAIMAFMAKDILRAIGAVEESPNHFVWDREAVVNVQFMADIIHEKDFKDPSKMRSKWVNFKPLAPLTSLTETQATGVEQEEEIPWPDR